VASFQQFPFENKEEKKDETHKRDLCNSSLQLSLPLPPPPSLCQLDVIAVAASKLLFLLFLLIYCFLLLARIDETSRY
jgi:hypothetical protein